MDSIFTAIRSYAPTPGRDSQEDFLTELFAWVLANVPGLGTRFCQFLLARIPDPAFVVAEGDEVIVETQVVVDLGRVDMVLRCAGGGLICEHKVASDLGHEQIERYAASFATHGGHYHTVLVTATTLQHTQDADVRLTWADIHGFLKSVEPDYNGAHAFPIRQLCAFLREQGLGGMEPITMENIVGYRPGRELPDKLASLFARIVHMDWEAACPGIRSLRPDTYDPQVEKLRWGRLGIELFNTRQPRLFVGVRLHADNVAPSCRDETTDPEVLVLCGFGYFKAPKTDHEQGVMRDRHRLLGHERFGSLAAAIREASMGFRYEQQPVDSPTCIFALYKPLTTVLRGAASEDEQAGRLFETLCQGVNIYLQQGILADILADTRTRTPEQSYHG